jgi:hypothetical protein
VSGPDSDIRKYPPQQVRIQPAQGRWSGAPGRGADADHDGFGLSRLRFFVPLLVVRLGHRAARFLATVGFAMSSGSLIRGFGKKNWFDYFWNYWTEGRVRGAREHRDG